MILLGMNVGRFVHDVLGAAAELSEIARHALCCVQEYQA